MAEVGLDQSQEHSSSERELSPRPAQEDRVEALRDGLVELMEKIGAKRASIRSWENYSKDTFLAFDSYNLGLTEAYEMLGNFIGLININYPERDAESDQAGP